MYALVNDIACYPEFVPYCVGSDIIVQTEDEIRASLSFASSGMSKSFTTLNRLSPPGMVEIRLVDGPFSQLEGFWRFEKINDDHCKVVLDLEFEFSSTLLKIMFGPVFHQVASTLVDAFTKRANEVYGVA